MVQHKASAAPKRAAVTMKIEEVLAGFFFHQSFTFRNGGYTIRHASGKGSSLVVTKNEKPNRSCGVTCFE